jgi:hypothetical protein
MKLTKRQTEAYRMAIAGEKQFILFGGAIRGGKTYWLLLTFISLCSKFPKSRWVIIRANMPTLERTTLVTFNSILNEGLSQYISTWDKKTQTVTFTNGSEILFMGENYETDKDLDRFKGLEINGGGIDEINECQEQTLYKLLERSGSWNNSVGRPPIVVLATCNPANNWVKEEIYDKWMKKKLPETWAYIPSKITDNPHIPADYLKSLQANMPEYEYLRFVEGDWEVNEKPENPFFIAYDGRTHESMDISFNPNIPLLISLDFNLQPFAGIVAQKWSDNMGDHFHIIDEFNVVDGSIPKMIDVIRDRYEPYLPMCLITGDAMGKRGDLSQRDNANYYEQLARGLNLRTNQIRVQPNPKHENSRAQCNYILRNHPDFKVNPKKCPNTARDFKQVSCDAAGNIIKRNRNIITQLSDHCDAVRYGFNTFLGDWYLTHLKKSKYKTLPLQ